MSTNLFEQLRLGGRGVADDADVDVSSQRRVLDRRFGNAAEKHQKNASLNLSTEKILP